MCDAYDDARSVKVLVLLKREVLLDERLVELAEALRCLVNRLGVLDLVGGSLVIKVQRSVVVLLA